MPSVGACPSWKCETLTVYLNAVFLVQLVCPKSSQDNTYLSIKNLLISKTTAEYLLNVP